MKYPLNPKPLPPAFGFGGRPGLLEEDADPEEAAAWLFIVPNNQESGVYMGVMEGLVSQTSIDLYTLKYGFIRNW